MSALLSSAFQRWSTWFGWNGGKTDV